MVEQVGTVLVRHDPDPFTMFDVFGFGRPLDHVCLMELDGVQSMTWSPPVRMVAEGLGWTIERIKERYEKRVTDRRLDVASRHDRRRNGRRRPLRDRRRGRRPRRRHHRALNRMAADLTPDWPTAPQDGTYRIQITGSPTIDCGLAVGRDGIPGEDGMVATTMRIVNAIGAVVDAEPGLVSFLDLPLTLPPGD